MLNVFFYWHICHYDFYAFLESFSILSSLYILLSNLTSLSPKMLLNIFPPSCTRTPFNPSYHKFPIQYSLTRSLFQKHGLRHSKLQLLKTLIMSPSCVFGSRYILILLFLYGPKILLNIWRSNILNHCNNRKYYGPCNTFMYF